MTKYQATKLHTEETMLFSSKHLTRQKGIRREENYNNEQFATIMDNE